MGSVPLRNAVIKHSLWRKTKFGCVPRASHSIPPTIFSQRGYKIHGRTPIFIRGRAICPWRDEQPFLSSPLEALSCLLGAAGRGARRGAGLRAGDRACKWLFFPALSQPRAAKLCPNPEGLELCPSPEGLELHVGGEGARAATPRERGHGGHPAPAEPAGGVGHAGGDPTLELGLQGTRRGSRSGAGARQRQGPFAPSPAPLPPRRCPRPAPLSVRIRCSEKIWILFSPHILSTNIAKTIIGRRIYFSSRPFQYLLGLSRGSAK